MMSSIKADADLLAACRYRARLLDTIDEINGEQAMAVFGPSHDPAGILAHCGAVTDAGGAIAIHAADDADVHEAIGQILALTGGGRA